MSSKNNFSTTGRKIHDQASSQHKIDAKNNPIQRTKGGKVNNVRTSNLWFTSCKLNTRSPTGLHSVSDRQEMTKTSRAWIAPLRDRGRPGFSPTVGSHQWPCHSAGPRNDAIRLQRAIAGKKRFGLELWNVTRRSRQMPPSLVNHSPRRSTPVVEHRYLTGLFPRGGRSGSSSEVFSKATAYAVNGKNPEGPCIVRNDVSALTGVESIRIT